MAAASVPSSLVNSVTKPIKNEVDKLPIANPIIQALCHCQSFVDRIAQHEPNRCEATQMPAEQYCFPCVMQKQIRMAFDYTNGHSVAFDNQFVNLKTHLERTCIKPDADVADPIQFYQLFTEAINNREYIQDLLTVNLTITFECQSCKNISNVDRTFKEIIWKTNLGHKPILYPCGVESYFNPDPTVESEYLERMICKTKDCTSQGTLVDVRVLMRRIKGFPKMIAVARPLNEGDMPVDIRLVDIPFQLDLGMYCVEQLADQFIPNYRLFGIGEYVSEHTREAKSEGFNGRQSQFILRRTEDWYLLGDSLKVKLDKSDVRRIDPYVCFYERTDNTSVKIEVAKLSNEGKKRKKPHQQLKDRKRFGNFLAKYADQQRHD